jgi:hypothetical protein
MDPATILFATKLIDIALLYGFPAARKIAAAVYKPNPTLEDWEAAFETPNTDAFLERTKDLGLPGTEPK